MVTGETIKVEYELYTSKYSIRNKLPKVLRDFDILAFDTETRSSYNKKLRREALEYSRETTPSDSLYKHAMVVANSSGLSYPSIVKTTHFIFGESKSKSHVVVCTSAEMEMFVWKLVADYKGTLLVHNSLFDMKICYQRLGRLPPNIIDTALMVKCLINHVDIWKAKTSLKELMGSYYPPKWALMNDYEPEDLKHEDFIIYAAIDGAATFYLYTLILVEMEEHRY